jgi:hypothetical protein
MGSQTRKEKARARRQARHRMQARKRTRQEATRQAGEPTVAELLAAIQAAQQLYPSEVADPLVGEPPEAYGVIQRAVEAAIAQFWLYVKSIGARGSRKADHVTAQHMVIVLDLVYRGFAAGVDHGRHQVLGETQVDQDLVEGLRVAGAYHETLAVSSGVDKLGHSSAWHMATATRIMGLADLLQELGDGEAVVEDDDAGPGVPAGG